MSSLWSRAWHAAFFAFPARACQASASSPTPAPSAAKRARLEPENVEKLTFVHDNWNLVAEDTSKREALANTAVEAAQAAVLAAEAALAALQ